MCVDGSRIRKQKVADSKIPGYTCGRGQSVTYKRHAVFWLMKYDRFCYYDQRQLPNTNIILCSRIQLWDLPWKFYFRKVLGMKNRKKLWIVFLKKGMFLQLCQLHTRVKRFKTESARRWSNKWTKILYQDYLHCIANFCRALLIIFSKQFISSNTKRRKRMLNFVWNT